MTIKKEAEKRGIYVIEDCCEAVGSEIEGKKVGSYGAIGTFSFYPAHQITAGGGGGMCVTDSDFLMRKLKSMRDWGKKWTHDSHRGGNKTFYTDIVDNTNYHSGYIYDHLGWNFKLPEMCAAFGRVQLKRNEGFMDKRAEIYEELARGLKCLEEEIVFQEKLKGSRPNWFGFVMTLKRKSRNDLGNFLEENGIMHRPFFAGNITRHPPFWGFFHPYKVADLLMNQSLFVGCHPDITEVQYMIEKVKEFFHA